MIGLLRISKLSCMTLGLVITCSHAAQESVKGQDAQHAGGHPHANAEPAGPPMDPATLLYPGEERYLRNVRQLTFDGENAEAYWSPDGKKLVYQARTGAGDCDQIYTLDLASGERTAVSDGTGRTTCAYFTYPDGDGVLYASTHLAGEACPPEPDHSRGYVWAIYPSYDIFVRRGDEVSQLTHSPGYDAEATACFVDGRVVFTSTRGGDLDLWVMDPNKPDEPPQQLTDLPGYDGGAFFSPDCSRLVWRASRPSGEALEEYRALLADNLVRPSHMEIHVANADGSDARQVTHNGAANFAPYFMPDNRRILFSSSVEGRGRNFDLYMMDPYAEDPEATVERITHSPVFEAFPVFSPDGRYLVFASNRAGRKPGDTNLFIAEWVD